MKEIPHGSESFRKRNPHLFQPVGAMEHPKPQQREIPALDRGPRKQKGSGRCVVQCVITIVSYRPRLIDDDNLIGGAKSLRDAIAISLGIDDGDPRLRWEYSQVQTEGEEGTQVLITKL